MKKVVAVFFGACFIAIMLGCDARRSDTNTQQTPTCKQHVPAASDSQQPSEAVKKVAQQCFNRLTHDTLDIGIGSGVSNSTHLFFIQSKAKMGKIIDWEREDDAADHRWNVAIEMDDGDTGIWEGDCVMADDHNQSREMFDVNQPLPECK